ncbi:MAG TPA: cell envelope integrity protein TolA [Candidatus Udaeobacter sp.]|nr:cell envelope integrity protein TolA [Candidatus Udaeobacter sp.]
MRAGATLSLLLHLAILLMILLGLPDLFKPEEVIEPVAVQLATVADMTAQPQPSVKPIPTPVIKPVTQPLPAPAAPQAPTPPPLPTPPQPAAQTPPPLPPDQAPQPVQPTVAEPPQPVIIPDQTKPPPQQQQAKIEPQPVPQLRPKVPPDQTKPKVKPQPQQQATDFNSLLKNVEKMNTQTADNTDQQQTPQPPDTSSQAPLGERLTSSELDAAKSQMQGCWYIDPGKKGADSILVDVHVVYGADGSVTSVQAVDQLRIATDPVFRSMAEAAVRAVYKCDPIHLPPDKYDLWKSVTFTFGLSGLQG